jgi:hypothetical protein
MENEAAVRLGGISHCNHCHGYNNPLDKAINWYREIRYVRMYFMLDMR